MWIHAVRAHLWLLLASLPTVATVGTAAINNNKNNKNNNKKNNNKNKNNNKINNNNEQQHSQSQLSPNSGSSSSLVEKAGSCWSIGFTFETCCAPEHGPEGNPECWDEVYTYESCCAGSGDPTQDGCEGGYFTRFRRFVAEYYASENVRPALLSVWMRIMATFEARFMLCPAAALQAALLQLEERAAYDSSEQMANRFAGYALRLQHGFEKGLLTPDLVRSWPLEHGLQRARDVLNSRATARISRLSGRPMPSVSLILSYCREKLDWMNVSFSRSVLPFVDLVLVAKCPGADALEAVPFRRLWRSVEVVAVEDLPLRADECSAYLGYLEEFYHRLPEHMVFVHADMPEHIGLERPNIADDTLRALVSGTSISFAHLGNNRVTMSWNPHVMSPLWQGLFASSVAPLAGEVSTYCCSHFVVSRERVQLRPRSFYADALDFVTSAKSYFYLPGPRRPALQKRNAAHDMDGRLVCQNMMFVWHVIFGERLDLPHRMLDASLPLFLKIRNIRTAYFQDNEE
ncbi:unnamed protein product [Polarella glacialis]|uniref:Protein xylosyltransferase n=1 Tax=Polarella glacialis TaxID=89957 RepID=A0A813FE45_POLGL|nr:unnamed protein product [Polarella glacialis]CAE8699808.1 unnamed protein product [Polarella glacialis]